MTPYYHSFVLRRDLIETNGGLTLSLAALSAMTQGQDELPVRPPHAEHIGTIAVRKINKVIHTFIAVGVRCSDHVSQIVIKAGSKSTASAPSPLSA
jgi:hypothetical protein